MEIALMYFRSLDKLFEQTGVEEDHLYRSIKQLNLEKDPEY